MLSLLLFSLFIRIVLANHECPYGGIYLYTPKNHWYCYSVQEIVAACLLLAVGAYFMGHGFPLFTATIALVGLVLGAGAAYVALHMMEPRGGYPLADTVYLCVSLGIGLMFAGIAALTWRISFFFLFGVAGYCFSLYLWSWKENFMIEHTIIRHLLSLSIALLFSLTVLVVEFVAVILCTSFLGAYLFVFGLDLFVRTGFSNSIVQLTLKHSKKTDYVINPKIYAMLFGILALWLISSIWQVFFNRGKRFGLRVIENKNDTLKAKI